MFPSTWPRHLVFISLLALCPLQVFCQTAPILTVTFEPMDITINMNEMDYINFNVAGEGMQVGDQFSLSIAHSQLAGVDWNSTNELTQADVNTNTFNGEIRIRGKFLGRTDLTVTLNRGTQSFPVDGNLPIIVVRPQRVIDTIFVTSVGLFVSLIFINFGCAMHWPTVKGVIKRPVGPAIGMVGQFLFMPLSAFALGFVIFPDSPAMRLGMFFTGVAPGGGASNIWTFILGGNLNLSLTMTSISTLASFGFMPAWLFSLGQVVFANANIVVPYTRIATFVVGLIIPMCIGLAMQRYTPRLAAFMVKILKGFSTTLLLFIIIFAIVTNIYIFELFNWQIVVAGMGMPWLGYCFGYAFARLLKQPHPDALAISIETGIQNTGIAIFLLRYALGQPEADLTTVVPVSAAIMTPGPMICIFIYQKIKACIVNRGEGKKEILEEDTPPGTEVAVVAAIDLTGGKDSAIAIEDGKTGANNP